ncbi:phosphotransferase [Streptomyces malaysiensis subsp. malaysiensis]|uniref:Phosphotransferase n=1 Tax=Streptomyces autolyticus TaxID=75293 RepID=A0ABM6HQE1_9ACTN|nr:phosphotransferase [Streptomyces autolyticus]
MGRAAVGPDGRVSPCVFSANLLDVGNVRSTPLATILGSPAMAERMRPKELKAMNRELPGPGFWALIQPHTGVLSQTQPTARGFGSDLTAIIECEKGPFFVKAMRNRPGGRRASLIRERLINPAVQPISPTLLWHADDDEWLALGFDVVDARRSDFTPASPDLPGVVDLVDRLGDLPIPDIARDWPESRWDRFAVDETEAELFRGDALLHTDINPSNLILGERGRWIVDWSWPTRGAGFIDPACLVVQLIAAGHTPEAAEAWAAGCRAWADADSIAIDAFAAATRRMHRSRADRHPEATWLEAMAAAAGAWAVHRGVAEVPGQAMT